MSKPKNSEMDRLVRIESRLTQLGRWMGADLRRRPPANTPDSPVFIDEGCVFVRSDCTVGALSIAVRRYQWPEDQDEAPVILNGVEIGVVHPHIGDPLNGQHDS